MDTKELDTEQVVLTIEVSVSSKVKKSQVFCSSVSKPKVYGTYNNVSQNVVGSNCVLL